MAVIVIQAARGIGAAVGGPYFAGSYGYPSPNGFDNEGTGGDFLDSVPQSSTPVRDVPNFYGNSGPFFGQEQAGYSQLNDAAIAWAFTNVWLPYADTNLNGGSPSGYLATPWFCAVSFINPHDINDFPYTFGLTSPTNSNFTAPTSSFTSPLYQPPPTTTSSPRTYYGNNCAGGTNNTQCTTDGDLVTIPAYSNCSLYTNLPYGTGNNNNNWNWEDLTSAPLQYANNGKPGLQLYFSATATVSRAPLRLRAPTTTATTAGPTRTRGRHS